MRYFDPTWVGGDNAQRAWFLTPDMLSHITPRGISTLPGSVGIKNGTELLGSIFYSHSIVAFGFGDKS